MPRFPNDGRMESTIALGRDPYGYISATCRRLGTDVFEARIMLRRTICMTGPEAAELFYDPDCFERSGEAPRRLQKTLFGQGGVQGLDGDAHRHRKAMFMTLVTPERVAELAGITAQWWRVYAQQWAAANEVVLYSELQEVLCRAVCEWAGVPLDESEVHRRTRELTRMFDSAAAIGPKHWMSRIARRRADAWGEAIVTRIRSGELTPPEGSAAATIAFHRDLDGKLLGPRIAAVELLNVLRPTVAVSVYNVFAAHALHAYPACRDWLQTGDGERMECFVQEIRRFYPFFPSVVARVRRDFEWRGYGFPRGTRALLDLYGTNRDPRTWEQPEEFRPERFLNSEVGPYGFVPQGGGDPHANHRCPGEPIAVELTKVAAQMLMSELDYELPDQNLEIDRGRLPAMPHSRLVIRNVQLRDKQRSTQGIA